LKTNKAFIPQVKVFFPDFYVDLPSSEKLKRSRKLCIALNTRSRRIN
jgi:hypothetical protein